MESVITNRKKFEIIRCQAPYKPGEKALPDFVTAAQLTSNFENGDSSGHQLYLTSEAMSHIATHIGWGQNTQHNCVEQGGILLGQAFRDSEREVTYAVVNAAIAALSARGSSVHLEMSHETWKEMIDSVDRLLEESPQKELHVIGWYHTHPNGLPVFMSGTDRDTQQRMFAHDWQFAMVLNPQKSQWRSFFGAAAEECRGFVITDEEIKPMAIADPQRASLGEIEPAIIDEILIAPLTIEPDVKTDPVHHRRRKVKPRILLKTCVVLLVVIVALQLLTLGFVSAATLLRILR